MHPHTTPSICLTCGGPTSAPKITRCRLCWKVSWPPLEDRLWANVSRVDDPLACWIWTRAVSSEGYGRLNDEYTHIIAYRLAGGVIPSGWFVCHTCDNRPCLRNDGPQSTYTVKDATYIRFGHLFAAPRAANTHDAASKHRLPTGPCHWTKTHPELLPRGQRKGSNKLTDEDVRVIRREYASHAISQKALSQRYHVDPAVISRIVRHMIWRHVT
jgi:hypothetical protein